MVWNQTPRGMFGGGIGLAPMMPQQQAYRMPKLGTLDKLGLVGDLLTGSQFTQARLAPMQQMAMQEFQYQRQRGDKLEDWQRQRSAEQEDWLARQQWERDHPKPINNDTVSDYNFIAQNIGPEAAKQYLQNIANGPPLSVLDPSTGQYMLVPRGGYGAPAAPTPPKTLDRLPPNAKPVGGASPTGSRTFP